MSAQPYALIDATGAVVNVILADSTFQPPSGETMEPIGTSGAGIGWTYSNGAFVAPPTPIPTLAEAQSAQAAALSAACDSAIVAGFTSSALGSAHTYPSQPNDQTNLIGAATASQSPTLPAGWTCNFWCADSTGAWALRAHAAAQIQQVLADGVAAREALSTKLAALVAQVEAATTVAAVQSIAWA